MAARTALAMAAPSRALSLEHPSPVVAASTQLSQFAQLRIRTGFLQLKPSPRRAVLVCAGGRRDGKRPRSGMQARRKSRGEEDDDDAAAEKALEALFAQLEMDLNSEDGEDDDGEEFTDEELEQMSRELEAVFSGMDLEGLEGDEEEDEDEEEEEEEKEGAEVVDMVMTDGVYSEASGAAKRGSIQRSHQIYEEEEEDEDEDEYDEEDGDDEERMVPLEKWQIRKLAAAAEKGRRNVNVKSLAAEIGMDRSDVLSFLKDPPPELLLMAAQWDSEDAKAAASGRASIPELGFEFKVNVVDEPPRPAATTRRPPPTPSGGPQAPRSWHGAKRLKKEHIATFERVYRQSHRPSNAMIENLVNLTHVPRKKILQWFDEKRAENQHGKQSFGEASEN